MAHFLHQRSGKELQIIGRLSERYPYHDNEMNDDDYIYVAALAVDKFKKQHDWNKMLGLLELDVLVDIVVEFIITERAKVIKYPQAGYYCC